MSTNISTQSTNPHIAALEVKFAQAAKPIDWLAIAHNDAQMLRSLSSALNARGADGDDSREGCSAAVLEVSQDTWDFQGKLLPEMIEWALQQSDIKTLMLVGHSHAGGADSQASLVPASSDSSQTQGFSKLLAGVQRNQARNRSAEQRFAEQMQRLLEVPVLHNRWSNRELAVCGLFYRAESGLFLLYDVDRDVFHPLVAAS